MSTAELLMDQDDIDWFITATLENDLLTTFGEDDRDLGICPYITFYVYNQPNEYMQVAEKMHALFDEFSLLIDEPWQKKWKDITQVWLKAGDKRLPDDWRPAAIRSQARGRVHFMRATDASGPMVSPRWGISGVVDEGYRCYSTLKLTFRHKWFNQNKERWYAFVEHCLNVLQPEHCYSGFEVGNGGFNLMGAYEADVLERICADYFYGMDIDHPDAMGFQYHGNENGYVSHLRLGAGLRTPTWSFLLSPLWRSRLGKTEAEVREFLNDPRIQITALPYPVGPHNPNAENALWIRLGELDLYPVAQGLPDLLIKANELIKPIRCDELQLLTLDPWDDDPNPRFDYESSLRWMRRFDENSDWPSPEIRQPLLTASVDNSLQSGRCPANSPCLETGYWYTPAKQNSRALFKQGELMPNFPGSSYGATIWYWDGNQD
ncbi:hypothetical protein ACFQNF_16255 [Iodobacter arcticus]|uniref:DUF3396 domain-containing protein n=1 Tax=Iodobacter arcticus TaxID=590593 RepID=A0ABW2R218_9NEIS